MSFLGMQPTFTQVPPRPHVVPLGVGFTKSQTATLAPRLAASLDAAKPPEPPPMTICKEKLHYFTFQVNSCLHISLQMPYGTPSNIYISITVFPLINNFLILKVYKFSEYSLVGWDILKLLLILKNNKKKFRWRNLRKKKNHDIFNYQSRSKHLQSRNHSCAELC